MNIIGAGINIYADTGQAENALQRMAQRQNDLLQNSRIFSREFPRNLDRGFASMNRFRQGIDRSYTSIQQFRYETRRLTNELNSLVMAGVAVSMTGVSFMNFGRTVVGGFTQAIKQATTFEKTMKEIEFLGGLRGQVKEMKEIEREIMRIGVSLPTTNQKVAEGMVEAMKAGFKHNEAIKMAPIMSEMAFLSFDKLTEADSLKMMNSWLKTTAGNVDDARGAFDKFAKTADLFTTDLDGINRAFQSTRAAFDTMQLGKQAMGEESFLAMIGAMSTQYNARASGMMMNSFSRGLAQAVGSEEGTKRGDLWRSLGIDYEAEDDILATMDKISKASIKLWGDTKARQEKLIDLFGVEGLPVLQMMEKYEKSGKDIFKIRDAIKQSGGYSEEYMKHIMKTSYGTQKILEGTKETLVTLIGLTVLEPVNKILWGLSRVLEKITIFVQNHPQVAKFISLLVLSSGVLAMVAGSALLVGGAFMAMYGSVASAIVTLGQLTTTEETLRRGTNSLGLAFRQHIMVPMKGMMFAMARMAVVSGLLYLAWKHDFAGMRTSAMKLFNSFKNGKKMADELFSNSKMTWDQFVEIKSKKDPLTAWFADKFVKAKAFGQLMKGLWKDGIITAEDVGGEAEFNRLSKIWQETGMLEVADTILDWKHNVEAFWNGFLKGGEIARGFLMPIFKALGDVLVWIYDAVVWIGEKFGFLKNDASGMAPAFEKMGVVLGTIMGVAGGILLAFKAWRMTLGPIVGLLAKAVRFGGRMGGGLTNMLRGNRDNNGVNPNGVRNRLRRGRQAAADRGRRTIARGLLLDRAFPGVFGRDGGVRNPAVNPNMSREERLRQQRGGGGGRFHQWAWRRTRNRTTPQPGSLNDIGRYSQYRQRRDGLRRDGWRIRRDRNRGPIAGAGGRNIRTLNSNTWGGVMRDALYGRRLDVSQNRNGGWGYREINQHGQPVHRNTRSENLRFNRRGEVRTGRGLLGRSVIARNIGRAGRAVGNTRAAQAMAQTYGAGWGMLRQNVAGNPLVQNVRRQSRVTRMNTTGVAGARPGQRYAVRQRGGLIGGTMDTMFGSRTYDRQGNYVGRTRTTQGGGQRFRAQGRLGRGVNVGAKLLGNITKIFAKGGGKVGKILLKGILSGLKIGLRFIPIIGELLLAWELISLVWSNWDTIKAGANKAWEWIKSTISRVWEATKAWGLGVWDSVKTKGSEIWESIKVWAGQKWAEIKADAAAKIEELKTKISDIWSGLVEGFKSKWEEVKSWAANNPIMQGIKTVVNNSPVGLIGKGIQKAKDWLGNGHRTGLNNVPKEGYPAMLHRGEMVLTRREAQVMRAMSGTKSIFDTLMEAKDGYRTGVSVGPKSIQAKSASISAEGGGTTTITFAPGSVQISVQNLNSEAELERGARKMFEKFKRMVETENMRNYRPARS